MFVVFLTQSEYEQVLERVSITTHHQKPPFEFVDFITRPRCLAFLRCEYTHPTRMIASFRFSLDPSMRSEIAPAATAAAKMNSTVRTRDCYSFVNGFGPSTNMDSAPCAGLLLKAAHDRL